MTPFNITLSIAFYVLATHFSVTPYDAGYGYLPFYEFIVAVIRWKFC